MDDRIRIDALPTTVAPNPNHVVPAMYDGIAVRLSLAQIIALGRTATELANGTDFDTITSSGLFVLTSNVNAPVTGGRWLVSCYVDPAEPGRIVQQAIRITGGDTPSVYTRRSASGVFGAWSGGSTAAEIGAVNRAGDTMTGSLTVLNALIAQQATTGSNVHVWLRNIDGKNRGLLYWDRNTGDVHLRVYADDGNGNDIVAGNLALRANGTITFNNNTVWHSGNVDPWALMPQGIVAGLTLSNNGTDANNDIDIAPGTARGNGVTVTNSATLTKRLDAAWTVGNGNGGLDTGSKAASATYHVHAIRRNSDGVFDALFSTSATSPVMPTGWTRVQRLGAVMTDGSGNIRAFIQTGNEFRFNTADPTPDYAGTGNRAKAPLTCTLPNGIRVQGIFRVSIRGANGDYAVRARLFDGANTNIATDISTYVSTAVKVITAELRQYTNTSRQIQLLIDNNADPSNNSTVTTVGWIDYQIPRIDA